jgi:hypothetical protein
MGRQCLYRQALSNGEELIVTAYVAVTDEERRLNMERERAKTLQGLRAAIAAGADVGGNNIRGVVFSIPGPEAARDLQGVRVFTDVSFQRELLEAVE